MRYQSGWRWRTVKSVGIRKLKEHLSSYLREVQGGERILITDRKKALAVIAPVETDDEKEQYSILVDKGIVAWAGGKPAGVRQRISTARSVAEAVLEDRR
jgi:prevent-host-death family protein